MSSVLDFFTDSYFIDRRTFIWTRAMSGRKQAPILSKNGYFGQKMTILNQKRSFSIVKAVIFEIGHF